jgi:tetraacyldisaccharide 4'-kinase
VVEILLFPLFSLPVISHFFQVLRGNVDRFVQYTTDIIYDHGKKTTGTKVYTVLLKALSLVYGLAVKTRFALYNGRVLKRKPVGSITIVIGNLTVGGTGKTPITEKMARTLSERGRKVAILSRGYKSRTAPLWVRLWRKYILWEAPRHRVVSDGKRLLLESDEAGDEPYMLARNLLPHHVVVIVGSDRAASCVHAQEEYHCDTILLDDGMQYLTLEGSYNLLLVDKTNPFGNGSLLPRGILREPISNLSRGDYIFLTKSTGTRSRKLEAFIRRYNPYAEIIECSHRPKLLSSLDGKTTHPLSFLEGRCVAIFSGIATPQLFEDFVYACHCQVSHKKRFLDHHRFTEEELVDVFDEAAEKEAELVITTEKDAVRIDPKREWRLPLYYLRLEVDILSDQETFECAIARLCLGEFGQRRFREQHALTPIQTAKGQNRSFPN